MGFNSAFKGLMLEDGPHDRNM